MALAEQAVPSYLHPFPLMTYTFWRRIRKAVEAASRDRMLGNVLDFGCGAGVSLPFLANAGATGLLAWDNEDHARQMTRDLIREMDLANARVLESFADIHDMPRGSIDTVLALDVFEHIEDLDAVLRVLAGVMRDNGVLIVSSPTESWFYKLTRRLFGSEEFQQHYHFSNAQDVEKALAKYFDVDLVCRMYPPLVFFRIVRCTRPHCRD